MQKSKEKIHIIQNFARFCVVKMQRGLIFLYDFHIIKCRMRWGVIAVRNIRLFFKEIPFKWWKEVVYIMAFKQVLIKDFAERPFSLIADEWMLVTAGNAQKYNMMTASWGGLGEMWGKPVAVAVIRPQRYTKEFMDQSDWFTLSFYGDDKSIHKICGSKSGRNTDKTKETGLTPVFADQTVYFEQARLVLICKKLYVQKMDPAGIVDPLVEKWYPDRDYHYMYVGEVQSILEKE